MNDQAVEMSETQESVRASATVPDTITRLPLPRPEKTSILPLAIIWKQCRQAWTFEGLRNIRDWIIRSRWRILSVCIACLATVMAMIALKPAFGGEKSSERALDLAEWTATKDFFEYCSVLETKGEIPQTCVNVLNETLPPPPHLDRSKENIASLSAGLLEITKRVIELRTEGMSKDHKACAGLVLAGAAAIFAYLYTTYLYLEEYSSRPSSTLDEESQISAGWAVNSRKHPKNSGFLNRRYPDHKIVEIIYRGSENPGIARFTAPVSAADPASSYRQSSAIDYPQLGEYSLQTEKRETLERYEPLVRALRLSTSSGSLLETITDTMTDILGPIRRFAERELVHWLSEFFGVYRRPWKPDFDEPAPEAVRSYRQHLKSCRICRSDDALYKRA